MIDALDWFHELPRGMQHALVQWADRAHRQGYNERLPSELLNAIRIRRPTAPIGGMLDDSEIEWLSLEGFRARARDAQSAADAAWPVTGLPVPEAFSLLQVATERWAEIGFLFFS